MDHECWASVAKELEVMTSALVLRGHSYQVGLNLKVMGVTLESRDG